MKARFFLIILLLICDSVFAQNLTTGSMLDLFNMSDSLLSDSKRIGAGGNFSSNKFNFYSHEKDEVSKNTNLYNLGYFRYYIPAENNRHKFILLNSFYVSAGHKSVKLPEKETNVTIFSFSADKGIGYKYSKLSVIPYTSSGNLSYRAEDHNFSGRKREFGIHFNIMDFAGLSFSYNNTIFNENTKLLETLSSRVIESVAEDFLVNEIASLFPNNELYPIYYWLVNAACKLAFIGLNRSNFNFPFNNEKQIEANSFNASLRFELRLF